MPKKVEKEPHVTEKIEKISANALTYDDVLLVPAYSEVMPAEVEVRTQLTKDISIHMPILSSAMDTVTESDMAIAMAMAGGIGFVHKNMSITRHAAEIRRVKRFQSGMIIDPIYLRVEASVGDALDIMRKYKIGGIPIVEEDMRLVGIITNRDLRFREKRAEPLRKIMTQEKLITVKAGTDLSRAEGLLQQYKIEKLPIVDAKGRLKGLITYKDILKRKKHPYACKDSYGRLRVGAAIGPAKDVHVRAQALVEAEVDLLCIDTAHAHSKHVISLIKDLKKRYSDKPLVVGNIATAAAARCLADLGVEAVKVGIGPGSICTTRVIAGVGVPQLSAILEVAQALSGTPVKVIADGGIRFSGDVTKALAGGADSVMIGSLLAGTEEAPGDVVLLQGKKYKTYRGMGSLEAMEKGSKERYFQESYQEVEKLVPEGIVGRVPYGGHAAEVLYQLVGGLRAGMGYCGAQDLTQLKKAHFIAVSPASVREGHPHDVTITQEAPNYSP